MVSAQNLPRYKPLYITTNSHIQTVTARGREMEERKIKEEEREAFSSLRFHVFCLRSLQITTGEHTHPPSAPIHKAAE